MVNLPDFPWDSLTPFRLEAGEAGHGYPEGLIDLSIGSPIDEAPKMVAKILATSDLASDVPNYPNVEGTEELQETIVQWYRRRHGVIGLAPKQVLPTIGAKELVATLPMALGIGPGDAVVQPELAYPTYDIGARLAGAETVSADDPSMWPDHTKLVWLNAPGNPDGKVFSISELKNRVTRARDLGAIIVNDECYLELGWGQPVPTILHPDIIDGDYSDVLSVYSLSKQSNLAGLRTAFVAGCEIRIHQLATFRKHVGLSVATPIQRVMTHLLADDSFVEEQKERYRKRREILVEAFTLAGFRVDRSEAGLYLWVTEGKDAWQSVSRLAKRGILVTPGYFYGSKGSQHIRVSLTAPDSKIAAIAQRL